MSKSEALLQKAEKRQPQSTTLPVSNYAISTDEVLALRCMARERQARPLPSPSPPTTTVADTTLILPHPHDIFALAPSGDSDSSP